MEFEARNLPRGRSFITSQGGGGGGYNSLRDLILGGQLCVSTCTAERSFSRMKRLQTPFRRTMILMAL